MESEMKKFANAVIIAAIFGAVPALANARENSEQVANHYEATPVVEVIALTADQARALAEARAEYRKNSTELKQSHEEVVSDILGNTTTR
jgi:hypothetical protein